MQERYLGDVHDFLKYKFLRHLKSETKFKIGLNWYLTRPEEVDPKKTKDGEKRFHLTGRNSDQWADWDEKLFDNLKNFKDPSERRLSRFHEFNILDKTSYFEDHVPITKLERLEWHKKAIEELKACDFVFLDPDNGLKVPSAKGKRVAKYVKDIEIKEYLENKQAVITIQFARQCNPIKKAEWARSKLNSAIGKSSRLPIMRCRVAPNILFVPAAPPDKREILEEAIRSFAKTPLFNLPENHSRRTLSFCIDKV